jgi:uncharacterized protein GlcG (DUF336 family)
LIDAVLITMTVQVTAVGAVGVSGLRSHEGERKPGKRA